MPESTNEKGESQLEKIKEWQMEKERLEERLKLLDEGQTNSINAGDILTMFTSLVVVVMYAWMVVYVFFHDEFIQRMFRDGLNYVSWSFMGLLIILPAPVVIKLTYDSFKKLWSKNNPGIEGNETRDDILKEINRLDSEIKEAYGKN